MQWMYFVNHYDNWSGSTQRKNISELEDMGTASQIAEACNYLCDEAAAGRHGGLYMVSLNDGNYIDSFEESDLEKAR